MCSSDFQHLDSRKFCFFLRLDKSTVALVQTSSARRRAPADARKTPTPRPSRKTSIMRSYPRNSPEAAARIVALVLISDGHVCSSEFDILKQLGAERELGLEPHLLPHIVHTLCEELLLGGYQTGSLMDNVDDSTLASLMAEISDPALQRTVLRLSLAAARADGHLAEGEALVVEAARQHWQLAEGVASHAAASARHHAA
jgi:hypothetical protein